MPNLLLFFTFFSSPDEFAPQYFLLLLDLVLLLAPPSFVFIVPRQTSLLLFPHHLDQLTISSFYGLIVQCPKYIKQSLSLSLEQ